ncbi:hypothetical protein [Paracoccus sp. ME4]|uniref:hypothetical protein n=1 Tax=Paracoccus sp. ME4 TaxID=3138066 RepID=UPI00398B64E9
MGGEYRHAASHGAVASSPIGLLLNAEDVAAVRIQGSLPVRIRATYSVELDLILDREDGTEQLCLVTPGYRIRPDQASVAAIILAFGLD